MKKLSIFLSIVLAIVMATVLFTSCEEQPGVYKPKKKISKVYQQDVVGQAEYLKEEWIWDGSKVSSIKYYSWDGGVEVEEEFKYDGNRVAKIVDSRGYYVDYVYTDEQFERVKFCHELGILLADITFQYNGKKISTLTLHNYVEDKNVIEMIKRGFVGKMLSKEVIKIVAEKLANQTKGAYLINFSYEGENIASISDGVTAITYSDYDTHSSIVYNFFPVSYRGWVNFNTFSKNNPGKSVTHLSNSVITYTYTYTYDGDYPVTIQTHEFGYIGDIVYDGTYTNRIEYQ